MDCHLLGPARFVALAFLPGDHRSQRRGTCEGLSGLWGREEGVVEREEGVVEREEGVVEGKEEDVEGRWTRWL